MNQTKRSLLIAFILIAIGAAFIATEYLVYMPLFQAYQTDTLNWLQTSPQTTPPPAEAYGITTTTLAIFYFLSWGGFILVSLGIVYIIVAIIRKRPSPPEQTPAASPPKPA
jgi:hypothetical protein